MTVYIDDMDAGYGQMVMCHMLADTDDELHAMADRIGVQRKWWQAPNKTSGSHYDISKGKKRLPWLPAPFKSPSDKLAP